MDTGFSQLRHTLEMVVPAPVGAWLDADALINTANVHVHSID